jgi:hypothetical protein
MYLIYFYSHISDEIIPKDVINDFSNIENNIIKIIKDIIIFEEGKKKADLLSIFKNDEKILFDGLDDGIYIQQKGNKYYFNKKMTKTILNNSWFLSSQSTISDNIILGYVSYFEIPLIYNKIECKNEINTMINKNLENKIKDVKMDDVSFDGVISELKRKFKVKNA